MGKCQILLLEFVHTRCAYSYKYATCVQTLSPRKSRLDGRLASQALQLRRLCAEDGEERFFEALATRMLRSGRHPGDARVQLCGDSFAASMIRRNTRCCEGRAGGRRGGTARRTTAFLRIAARKSEQTKERVQQKK